MRSFMQVFMIVVVISALGFSFNGSRPSDQGRRRIVLPADAVHEGWYFAAGDQVSILGTVNGDVYVGGGVVEIGGTINGELVAAGGQVDVGGTVTDRIFAGGGVVRIAGKVGKSVIAGGGTVIIARDAAVGDNLLAAAGNLQVDGTVEHEARVAGGDVDLSGVVKGNMEVGSDRFRSYPGAQVGGNLTVAARDSEQVSIAPNTVAGQIQINVERMKESPSILGMGRATFWFRILFGLTLFATALALAFLFPGHLRAPGTVLLNHPGKSVLWGFVLLVVTPVLVFILLLTVIGIPLGIFLFFLYLWFLYASQLVLGIAVGAKLKGVEGKKGWSLFGAVALGLLLIQVLMFVPIVGTLLIIAGLVFGLGALVLAAKAGMETLRSIPGSAAGQ